MNLLMNGQETERLIFKEVSLSDYNEWLAFFKNPEASRHWSYERRNPETECNDWYANQFDRYATNRGGMNALVEKGTNRFIGHCGLLKQKVDNIEEIEIAYSLLPPFWNNGYATEVAIQCRNYAFSNNLTPSVISIISLTNIPSQRVAIKVGMAIDKTTVYKNNDVNIFRICKP